MNMHITVVIRNLGMECLKYMYIYTHTEKCLHIYIYEHIHVRMHIYLYVHENQEWLTFMSRGSEESTHCCGTRQGGMYVYICTHSQ
jgi:hypothetical protein